MLGAVPAPPLLGPEERVCVVIPAYRVERHIQDGGRGVPPWIWRIVVVDDASPDQTAERVRELSDPRVALIRHQQNQRPGRAMQTGSRTARGTVTMIELNSLGPASADVPAPASYGCGASSLSLRRALVELPCLLMARFCRRVWLQSFVLGFSVASLFVIVGFGLLAFASAW